MLSRNKCDGFRKGSTHPTGWIERAFDDVIAGSHKVPGAIWSLGKTLVDNAVRRSA